MRFLVDSCISKFVTESLRAQQHNVIWVPETGYDPGDEILMQQAYEENRILITAEKDFGDLVFVYNKPHTTIIRLVATPPKKQMNLLETILENYSRELQENVLITASLSRIRIKYPSDEENH